jgi:hypothetical protein
MINIRGMGFYRKRTPPTLGNSSKDFLKERVSYGLSQAKALLGSSKVGRG